MRIHIGKFNELLLYLEIVSPIKWFKYYNEIACYEWDDPPNGNKKIILQPLFFILPKYVRTSTLLHEYGHSLITKYIYNYRDKDYFGENYLCIIDEAFVDFYCCCKLKLHYNEYIKWYEWPISIAEGFRKRKYRDSHLKAEEKYNELDKKNKINNYKDFYNAINYWKAQKKDTPAYIYQFYKNPNSLIKIYNYTFDSTFSDYSNIDMNKILRLYTNGCLTKGEYEQYERIVKIKSLIKPFDWTAFLIENGWNNDEERFRYIN